MSKPDIAIADLENYDAIAICGYREQDNGYKDDKLGKCHICATQIRWRPHTPSGPKVLSLCPACGFRCLRHMREEGTIPNLQVTAQTSKEVEERTGIRIPPNVP